MISSFINIILRYGAKERGLFGKCIAYYGTVEAQARGTLHCHMLIWLEGHPSPQQMRDAMMNSEQYQADLFRWLESLIKCELLGTTAVVDEPDGRPLTRKKVQESAGEIHPGTMAGPQLNELSDDEFTQQYTNHVNELVKQYNWHEHTETCWKYLKRGESRSNSNCRMRMDGITRAQTSIDPETGSVQVRRLHPWIANYNDLVIFLMKANMDLKHIGSGEGAKALIYYVTDYITKSSLPAHLGLSALLYAINRASTKYNRVTEWEPKHDVGALTILINSMLARQEISHQQVMSYLVGGGDHYTSHRFRLLHFGSFERLISRYWTTIDGDSLIPTPGESEETSMDQNHATDDGDEH
ncbi:hypothetical protein C8Q76DRAFT_596062, partial [Earliella scabrosa]